MERLLGAARPLSLASVETSVSSCSTLSSPSSPPHAIQPLLLCHEIYGGQGRVDSNLTKEGDCKHGKGVRTYVCMHVG